MSCKCPFCGTVVAELPEYKFIDVKSARHFAWNDGSVRVSSTEELILLKGTIFSVGILNNLRVEERGVSPKN